LILLNGC